jgi:2-aminoadipate transaminase
MPTPWEVRYAQRIQTLQSSAISALFKLAEQSDIISFAGGLPAPEVFPADQIKNACNVVLRTIGGQALQYGTSDGYIPLRELIADSANQNGDTCFGINNVLMTSGSQQALDFIGRLLINPGDYVAVESPTYLGALQAWNLYGARYISVPMDEDGVIVEEMEKALRLGPKLIYLLPNFQNPSGVTLSLERRRQVVALAERYGVPIVEDDPYGHLYYDGAPLPSLLALDSHDRSDPDAGNVIYTSTYSKLLAPGLRLAWMIAPQGVIQKCVLLKQAADLHTSTFSQCVAHEVAREGFLDEHARTIRAVYQERRDVMLETMAEMFPESVSWTRPSGGMFLWVVLPQWMDATELLRKALEKKVAFVPGAGFYANDAPKNTLRMNFSYSSPEIIREGIARLAGLLREEVKTAGKPG